MLPEPAALALFALAALVLLVTPGPAVLYVVTRSIEGGHRAGMIAMLGVCTGLFVHVAAATLGVSALLAASPLALEILRYVGAAYLAWLGFDSLRPRRGAYPDGADPTASVAAWGNYRQGVLVNVLNPKAALFFVAFLPQFADPGRGALALQLLALGLLFVLLAAATDTAYALTAGSVAEWFRTRPAARRAQRLLAGLTYLGLALATALGGISG